MKDWQDLFDKKTLEKGKKQYLSGRVLVISEDIGCYEFKVNDKHLYDVDVITYISDGEMVDTVEHISCNCMIGSNGGFCSHMAAALFYVDNEIELWAADELGENNSREEKKSGDVYLENRRKMLVQIEQLQKDRQSELERNSEGHDINKGTEELKYFKWDKFTKDLDIGKALIKYGESCLEDSTVFNIKHELFYGDYERSGKVSLYGKTSGNMDSFYNCEIIFDREGIVAEYCGYYECRWNHKPSKRSRIGHIPCEHVTALVISTVEWLKETNPGDDTDISGIQLLSSTVSDSIISEETKNADLSSQVHLEPHVKVLDNNYPYLTFKIGQARLYKLKRISELVEKVVNCEVMQLGKNVSVMLNDYCFDEESDKWYRFIRTVVEDEYQQRHRWKAGNKAYRYIDLIPELTDEIPLYGNYLDLFYDTMGTQGVDFEFEAFKQRSKETRLTAMKGSLKTELSVNQFVDDKTSEFLGVRLTGEMPKMIHGQQYSYYLDERHIYRIESEYARKLSSLSEISKDGRIDAIVGRKHLSDLYYKTLPFLRKYIKINEYDQDIIYSYLPPEPEFVTYFDIEDEMILCRAEVSYGGRLHSLYEHLEKDSGFESYRNVDSELKVIQCILKYVRQYDKDVPVLFTDRSEDTIFKLMTVGFNELMKLSEIRVTDRFKRLKVRNGIKVNIGVSVKSNILNLDIKSDEFTEEELLEILSSYRAKKRYYRLKSGDFIDFEENDSVAQLSELMETVNIPLKKFVSGKMQIPAYRALYLDKMLEEAEGVYAERDRKFKRIVKEFKAVEDSEFELPVSLKKILRKYQKTGYRWMRTLDNYGFGGILADEMGLGKTLQTIALLLSYKLESGKKKNEEHHTSLIVCPASLVYNWKEELIRFAPELNCKLVVGTKEERNLIIEAIEDFDVVVTSYDLLKRDIDCYEGIDFRYEIIDEAQNIKNQTTAAAKAVKVIKASTKFALTGTPIENRLSELWSIFDYLMPGFMFDYQIFKEKYETPIAKYDDKEALERLSRMAAPFILRRRKKDVLKELPDKLEEIRYAGMTDEQRRIYDGRVVKLKNLLEAQSDEDYNRNKLQVFAELTRIRQVCCDPLLVYEDYKGESAKRDSLMELIDGIIEGGHKALIFSQFTSMFEIIEKELQEKGIIYYKITGKTPKEKRVELVNAFNENDVPLFLISLKAGGTGLNLTGADIVVHYDPWWNVAAENQATDRAHRIGQTKVVTVYKLILKDTIEERIIEMQEAKMKLAEDILGNEAVGSSKIEREELLKLLE